MELKSDFTPALVHNSDSEYDVKFLKKWYMENNTYSYVISDLGQWYTMTIKYHGYFIEIRDSLKLLPFSVAAIGQDKGGVTALLASAGTSRATFTQPRASHQNWPKNLELEVTILLSS